MNLDQKTKSNVRFHAIFGSAFHADDIIKELCENCNIVSHCLKKELKNPVLIVGTKNNLISVRQSDFEVFRKLLIAFVVISLDRTFSVTALAKCNEED